MQVKDMTVEQLRDLIRHTVEQCLEEYFGDPDSGLEVKEEVKQKLLESIKRKKVDRTLGRKGRSHFTKSTQDLAQIREEHLHLIK